MVEVEWPMTLVLMLKFAMVILPFKYLNVDVPHDLQPLHMLKNIKVLGLFLEHKTFQVYFGNTRHFKTGKNLSSGTSKFVVGS
jgi:hypothetical protein